MTTDVVVIGGGATGAGIAWDLALRGIDAVLLEKDALSSGTSGRYHGLLHSGARYAVSDVATARECIAENAFARRIAPRCVDDTGGLFVLLPEDELSFVEQWLRGCQEAGIPVRELSPREARDKEPMLRTDLLCAFEVPDGVCHAFPLCASLAAGAAARGVRVLEHHVVRSVFARGGAISGVRVQDTRQGISFEIGCKVVVNAAGPWAGAIAGLAGVTLSLDLARGALAAFKGRLTTHVVQRLRLPDDADAILPRGQVSIGGTTIVATDDPADRRVDPWEPLLIRERLALLLPGLAQVEMVHVWSAVRPLYDVQGRKDGVNARTLSRNFSVLDHEERDGVQGFVTVVGGKLSTFRLMAERTVDLVCGKLGREAPCTTARTLIA
jgi:glycerol-3-phosphate dehydrogenase